MVAIRLRLLAASYCSICSGLVFSLDSRCLVTLLSLFLLFARLHHVILDSESDINVLLLRSLLNILHSEFSVSGVENLQCCQLLIRNVSNTVFQYRTHHISVFYLALFSVPSIRSQCLRH